MFCPLCKAEYRQGFTTCSDCEVALVSSLPSDERAGAAHLNRGRFERLWEGDDLALHASLLEALDAAKIPYFNRPLSVYPGIRRAEPFPVQPIALFGYKVAVFASDFPAAKQILEELLDQEPKDEMELPDQPQRSITQAHSGSAADEEPTQEVWRGDDAEFSRFLQDALRENDLPLLADSSGGQTVVSVRSSDAPRAREILRELTEASPPQ